MSLTFIDLFAGIGGFHFAGTTNGWRCVWANEHDPAAAHQYRTATGVDPDERSIQDVPSTSIPDHDVLFAGFPCQPYSVMGKRKGLADPRAKTIFEIFRILTDLQPQAFVLENVKGLATMDGGSVLSQIEKGLRESGYEVRHRALWADDFGVPQHRERFFIVGFRDQGRATAFRWPLGDSEHPPLQDVLVPDEEVDKDLWFTDDEKKRVRQNIINPANLPLKPAIWRYEDKKDETYILNKVNTLLTATWKMRMHVNGERCVTARELLRFQSFPDSVPIAGSYNQIKHQTGNAVPVLMAAAVAKAVQNALEAEVKVSAPVKKVSVAAPIERQEVNEPVTAFVPELQQEKVSEPALKVSVPVEEGQQAAEQQREPRRSQSAAAPIVEGQRVHTQEVSVPIGVQLSGLESLRAYRVEVEALSAALAELNRLSAASAAPLGGVP